MSLGPGIEFLYLSTRDPLPPAKVPLLAEGLQQAGPSAGPTQAMETTTFVKFLKTQHGIAGIAHRKAPENSADGLCAVEAVSALRRAGWHRAGLTATTPVWRFVSFVRLRAHTSTGDAFWTPFEELMGPILTEAEDSKHFGEAAGGWMEYRQPGLLLSWSLSDPIVEFVFLFENSECRLLA